MFAHILLCLLPAIVFARINVNIKASTKESESIVECLGANVGVISDKEVQTFGLNEAALKSAVQRFSGGWPNDVYLRSPTPWNDLYRTYGWAQVQTTLYPRNAKIIGIKSQPVIIATDIFENNSTVKAKYNAGITQDVQDTISNSWSKGGEISIGQEVNYSVDVVFGEVGGTTSFSFSSQWGVENGKSKTVTVGTNNAVEVELDPGQAVLVSLEATRGTMEIQVDYTASLSGDIACNYADVFRGHHFWRYDINAVQSAANLRRTVESTEIIKIGFYSEAKVVVSDRKSKITLAAFNVDILRNL